MKFIDKKGGGIVKKVSCLSEIPYINNGVMERSHIGLISHNCIEYIIYYFAILNAGLFVFLFHPLKQNMIWIS